MCFTDPGRTERICRAEAALGPSRPPLGHRTRPARPAGSAPAAGPAPLRRVRLHLPACTAPRRANAGPCRGALHYGSCSQHFPDPPGKPFAAQPSPALPVPLRGTGRGPVPAPVSSCVLRCRRCPPSRANGRDTGSHLPEAALAASSEHGGLRRKALPCPSPPQVREAPPPPSCRPGGGPAGAAAALGAGGQRQGHGRRLVSRTWPRGTRGWRGRARPRAGAAGPSRPAASGAGGPRLLLPGGTAAAPLAPRRLFPRTADGRSGPPVRALPVPDLRGEERG